MYNSIENLSRKVDAIYHRMFIDGGIVSPASAPINLRENKLEEAIRKAIVELELTKSSFKSKQIMRIKEELEKVLDKKG